MNEKAKDRWVNQNLKQINAFKNILINVKRTKKKPTANKKLQRKGGRLLDSLSKSRSDE
jgi:hypothetical protein